MPKGARYVNQPITLTETATEYMENKTKQDGSRTHAAHLLYLIEVGYDTREKLIEALSEDERYANLKSFTSSNRTFVSGYLNWLKKMSLVQEETPEPKVKKVKKVKQPQVEEEQEAA